ncbi:MAG: hypothetical protein KGI88_05150 [Betaproteobacteria bacterium]|nr:hypothetical protein [Betaproteobacteria bacterium]
MKKATRFFLKVRPNTILRTVLPIKIDGALPKHCWQNSSNFANDNSGFNVISGWIIGDFFGDKGTAIIPHYWVENRETFTHYDPTPHDGGYAQTYEYVEDLEIFEHGTSENYIPAALNMTKDGILKAVTNNGYLIELESFSIKRLYQISSA